jgi:hypothetical protein
METLAKRAKSVRPFVRVTNDDKDITPSLIAKRIGLRFGAGAIVCAAMHVMHRLSVLSSILILLAGCDGVPPAASAPVMMLPVGTSGSAAVPGAAAGSLAAGAAGSGVSSGVAGSRGAAGALGVAGTPGAAGTSVASAAGASAAGAGAAGVTAPAPSAGAAGGVAGASGATAGGSAVAGAGAPEMREDLGKGDGTDVITVGDSWMSYALNGGGIETGLLAASGQRYRTYGVAGTMLLNEVIPNQYKSAKRANPNIKTVVMTGGGNDLLLTGMTTGGCTAGCMSTIDDVTQRLKEMWEEMAADGVEDVIYIEYSRGGGNAPGVNYANQVIPPVCAAAPVRCHFIDSDLIINMELIDGVHPTASGCTKLGKAAFDLMVEKGMRR